MWLGIPQDTITMFQTLVFLITLQALETLVIMQQRITQLVFVIQQRTILRRETLIQNMVRHITLRHTLVVH
jgi:hypothetical protein